MSSLPAPVRRDIQSVPLRQKLPAQSAEHFTHVTQIMPRILCDSFLLKIEEQIERTNHLAGLLPAGAAEIQSEFPGDWTAGELLGHLLDCLAGFCAALYAAEPAKLAHFDGLRSLPVNLPMGPAEFSKQAEIYRAHISEAFALLDDSTLARSIPTVFVPAGQSLATLLLGNLEHLINHKRQLFESLKRLQVQVGTSDLYALRS
jgi:DinB family protein